MKTIRLIPLLFVLTTTFSYNCHGIIRKAAGAQLTEGVLAASLGLCNAYEQTPYDEHTEQQKAVCAFARTAYATAFLTNHRHTYLGLKVALSLLGIHDAVTFARAYANLLRHPEETPSKHADEEAATEHLFSPRVHGIAQQVELCSALLLTLCCSNRSLALRCEYLSCLAMLYARAIGLAEKYQGKLVPILLAGGLVLMTLDFAVPGSPFNTLAAARDLEFEEYMQLQEDLVCNTTQLNRMRITVDKQLASKLTLEERQHYVSFGHSIDKNRTLMREMMCCNDTSLQDVRDAIKQVQAFFDQNSKAPNKQ